MMRSRFLPLIFILSLGVLSFPVLATDVAVVDVQRLLSESRPGKSGEEHLQKVQGILQNGLDELVKVHAGKENTPAAQAAIRQGYVALEQQMAVERQAVMKVLGEHVEKAVKDWRAANSRSAAIVINRQLLLDADKSVDVTSAVMKELDKAQPKFPDLPSVQVTPPKETTSAAPAPAPQPKPAPAKKR